MIDWSTLSVRTSNVSEALSARLEQLILGGSILPGERLPPESDFAGLLGVSRASVREALHELALKGLIDRRPGRGTVVNDPHRTFLTGTLLGSMDDQQRTLLEVMDFREAIEPPIAARAAGRATPADLTRLQDVLRAMEGETSPAETAALDSKFHYLVARTTHNPLLVRLVELTTEWTLPSRTNALQSARRREVSLRGHRHVLEAITERDADGAMLAMSDHIRIIAALASQQAHPRVSRRPALRRTAQESEARPAERDIPAPR